MVKRWSTFRTLFLACLVHLLSFCSAAPRSIGTITCGVTGQTSGCGIDEECSAECRYPCSKADVDVIGTVNYTDSSSICKAAFHDLRITFYSRAITFVRRNIESRTFMGSYRYGVQSQSSFFSGNTGWFQFTSSRISEPVLDVTTLHKNFLYRNGESPVFECHGPKKGFQAEFAWYPEFLTQTTVIDTTPKKENGYFSLMVPETEFPTFKTTGYWCRVKNNVLSDVGSVAMFYDPQDEGGNYPDFLPEKYSTTVSTGQDFSVPLQRVRSDGRITGWTKDGLDRLVDPIIRHNLTVQKAQISDGGLYFAEGRHTATPGKNRALTRVIVRACPVGIYGPNCEHSCSDCQNGGICHDITGDCICPPGFNGSLCENPCGDDSFGADCSKKCSSSNANKEDKTCKGILMCRPDPYGCSCGTGFKGFFCNETCDINYYGAGCTQYRQCHCKNGKSCDVHTGTCLDGCDDGWKPAPLCDISYPLLASPPEISGVTSTGAEVQFTAWNSEANVDIGEGDPKAYLVQYKVSNSFSQWTPITVSVQQGLVKYNLLLRGLQPDTNYNVRVIVVNSDDGYREYGAQEARLKTLCGRPSLAPENVRIKPERRRITIFWENPPKESWNCRTANIAVNASGTIESFKSSQQSYTFQSDPFTNWNFTLRLETVGGIGPWSQTYYNRTLEDAPSKVQNLQSTVKNSSTVLLSWKRPDKPNGIIRFYNVSYKQTGWVHLCNMPLNSSILLKTATQERIIINDLGPSSMYRFNVAAVTVEKGQEEFVSINTTEAGPNVAPQAYVTNINKRRALVRWENIPCTVSNGDIKSYTVRLLSLDAWDKNRDNISGSIQVQFTDLIPYTRYMVQISGNTAGGKGKAAAEINFTTLSDAPPPPSNLTFYHVSKCTISLTWLPPYPPYGKLQLYNLEYNNSNQRLRESDVTCEDVSRQSRHCYTLQGLQSMTLYHIKILAINEGNFAGSFSSPITVITQETVPDPPSNVTVIDKTERSFSIVWKEPFRANGNLTMYRVNLTFLSTFSLVSNPDRRESITREADDTKMQYFQGLIPASVYDVCVEASTKVGYGDPYCINVTTRAQAPSFLMKPFVPGRLNQGMLLISLESFTLPAPKPLIKGYYVVVVEGEKIPSIENFVPLPYNTSKEQGLMYYTAAHLLPEQLGSSFLVGDDQTYNQFHNSPLDQQKGYRIGLVTESFFDGETRYGASFSDLISSKGGTNVSVAAIVVVLLIVAAVGGGAGYYVYKRKPELLYRVRSASFRMKKRLSKVEENMTDSRMTLDIDITSTEFSETLPRKKLFKPIAVKNLQAYIQDEDYFEKLKQEYLSVGKSQLHSWEDAKRPENKSQNRYGNILPYDHSRVKLSRNSNIEGSDYINASYVSGYKFPRRYIATQGPKQNTVADFWRMVWEERSFKIVMLTNLMEGQKVKCEKYWPDTTDKYGKLGVTLVTKEVFTDFVVRKFLVNKEKDQREVRQFHFISWPDHGVPVFPGSIYPLIKAIHNFMPESSSPIIVHCSGGIGRTGTFILIDSMLTKASVEGKVDVLGHLCEIRNCRVNLVESLEQYDFAYKALVEILCNSSHKLSTDEFLMNYENLKRKKNDGKSATDKEFEELQMVTQKTLPDEVSAEIDMKNAAKNRNPSIIPADNKRPYLKTGTDAASSDYVNAVFVDGFKSKDRFLVTQFPLPKTIADFWQMVYERDSRTIVTLNLLSENQQETPRFWPSDACSVMYRNVMVEHVSEEVHGPTIVRTLKISEPQTKPRVVKQFHLTEWPVAEATPPSASVLVDLMQEVERWQQKSENKIVVVQCLDGNHSCGIYCAAENICEQIKHNQEVDVFRTAKNIRDSRPQFITNQEQYEFCFDVAFSFLETFDMYSNFK